jgi:cytochrome oxidase Cu insertion factor (SCO1/SenC/PrrC family)
MIMRFTVLLAILLATIPASVFAQRKKKNEDAFPRERPAVGQMLPEVVVYDVHGKEVSTASFRGHYTVLTFGCLT